MGIRKKVSKSKPSKSSKKLSDKQIKSQAVKSKSSYTNYISKNEITAFEPKGIGAYAGGGKIGFVVNSIDQGLRILYKYQKSMGFWQVGRDWKVRYKGKFYQIKGYSPGYSPSRVSRNHLIEAIDKSSDNAGNRVAGENDSDKAYPDIVKPANKKILIIVWFPGTAKSKEISAKRAAISKRQFESLKGEKLTISHGGGNPTAYKNSGWYQNLSADEKKKTDSRIKQGLKKSGKKSTKYRPNTTKGKSNKAKGNPNFGKKKAVTPPKKVAKKKAVKKGGKK